MARRSAISMQALQRVDQTLGALLCLCAQPLRLLPARRAGPVHSVLVIKFWGIGSLQLLTPAVKSLRRRHPDARLELLTLSGNASFARSLAVFDHISTLDVGTSSWIAMSRRILRLAWCLMRARYDAVYDFEFFTRFSALMTLCTRSPHRHGFASPKVWRGGFHTDVVPFNRYWHVARNFRVLAGGENGLNPTAHDVAAPRFSLADEERVTELLAVHGVAPGEPLAVLNVNAGQLSLERRWHPSRFAELAGRLVLEDQTAVVLIGSDAEREYTARVHAQVREDAATRVTNLAGKLDGAELGALLARAAVVVSNDSGPMHFAAAIGAPTLGLFGPETPLLYHPLGLQARALYRPTPCSPCINVHDNKLSSCHFGEPQCLMQISVDEVLAAARALRRGETFELHPAAPLEPARER